MPNVVSTSSDSINAVAITRPAPATAIIITQAQIQTYLANNPTATTTDLENYISSQVAQASPDFDFHVHVYSLSPLSLAFLTSDPGVVVGGNWWVDNSVKVGVV